jgi:4-amino-4-deoxy-L-arabinose transferase-like glycosyltransferase
MPHEQHKWQRRFWVFFGLSLALRLLMALTLDLTPDEAYYWELSRRLDLSYFDHPPMVAYCISFCRALLGDRVLAVRLPALLCFSGVLVLLFNMTARFTRSREAGFWSAILLHGSPAGVALGFITTPDAPLALAWAGGLYMVSKILEHDTEWHWVLLGAALACGAMSKYNMIFFCPGVAALVLGFRERHQWLKTRRFWVMFGLAFVGALPILIWNYNHDWISLRFQFAHGFKPSSRSTVKNIIEFLGGQLGTIGLGLYPLLWYLTFHNLAVGWQKNDQMRFFYAAVALPTMLFFVYTSMHSKVEANWPQVAYLSALVLAGEWFANNSGTGKRWGMFAPSLILAFLAVFQAQTLLLPIPRGSDVSTRLHGWKELGALVRDLDHKTGKKAFFLSQGAPFTALVGFYGKIPPQRLTEIHGVGNWKFWWKEGAISSSTPVILIDNGVFSEIVGLSKAFSGVTASGSLPVTYQGKTIRTLYFHHLEGFNGKWNFQKK